MGAHFLNVVQIMDVWRLACRTSALGSGCPLLAEHVVLLASAAWQRMIEGAAHNAATVQMGSTVVAGGLVIKLEPTGLRFYLPCRQRIVLLKFI